jgi:hypothetical protein
MVRTIYQPCRYTNTLKQQADTKNKRQQAQRALPLLAFCSMQEGKKEPEIILTPLSYHDYNL